jgi:hypothetical protein
MLTDILPRRDCLLGNTFWHQNRIWQPETAVTKQVISMVYHIWESEGTEVCRTLNVLLWRHKRQECSTPAKIGRFRRHSVPPTFKKSWRRTCFCIALLFTNLSPRSRQICPVHLCYAMLNSAVHSCYARNCARVERCCGNARDSKQMPVASCFYFAIFEGQLAVQTEAWVRTQIKH